jgi:L-asparaginase II
MSNALAAARMAVARASQAGDPEKVATARTELNALKLEAAITKALDCAPPIPLKRRRQIARLLTQEAGQ